jgi:hypothetical protein
LGTDGINKRAAWKLTKMQQHRVGWNEAGLLAGTAQTGLWRFANVYRRQRQSRRPKFRQLHGLLVPAYKF